MTDNRTNEPTEAQIEHVRDQLEAKWPEMVCYWHPHRDDEERQHEWETIETWDIAEAALVAAQGAAPAVSGSTSDGYHTFDELYEYRMLYNAHAAHGWLAAGIPVVKSWRHSDGEECFGGGWFIVTATLPSGQVSNHYKAEHWGLFKVPEVELPPEYDGHTPHDVAMRLRIEAEHAAQVLPSSGVDEDKLAEVIARASVVYSPMLDEEAQNLARAVAEWLKGQGVLSRLWEGATMTTTPNPTAEKVIADAITAYWADEERSGPNRGPEAHDRECGIDAAKALRAHGLLSEGAPSEAPIEGQVSQIARNLTRATELTGASAEVIARAALKIAAGVAPQERPDLDPKKVAEVIATSGAYGVGWEQIPPLTKAAYGKIARALCEAYEKGELTK